MQYSLSNLTTALSFLYSRAISESQSACTETYQASVKAFTEADGRGFYDVGTTISPETSLQARLLEQHILDNDAHDIVLVQTAAEAIQASSDQQKPLQLLALSPHTALPALYQMIECVSLSVSLLTVSSNLCLPSFRTMLKDHSCLTAAKQLHTKYQKENNIYCAEEALASSCYFHTPLIHEVNETIEQAITRCYEYLLGAIGMLAEFDREGDFSPSLLWYNPWTYTEAEQTIINETLGRTLEHYDIDLLLDLVMVGNVTADFFDNFYLP